MARVRQVRPKNLTLEEIYDRFILFNQSQGLVDRTIDDYRYHITNLFVTQKLDLRDYNTLKMQVARYFVESSGLSAIFN